MGTIGQSISGVLLVAVSCAEGIAHTARPMPCAVNLVRCPRWYQFGLFSNAPINHRLHVFITNLALCAHC